MRDVEIMRSCRWAAACLALVTTSLGAEPAPFVAGSDTPLLPPARSWKGASRALVAEPGDPWITPCETSGMIRTPRYDETVQWLRRLCDAAPELEMISIGKSCEGRDIWMVVATHAGAFTPAALHATGKPTVLAQAGIHAGEIDGKDAGLMLLRDLSVRGKSRKLLDDANLLFVPILNVDGHERWSPYSRINQRGPVEAGWRTTARNLNLNRDYSKLDAPETRAVVRAVVEWDPDLYVDLHVTDGGYTQYDVRWGSNGELAGSPHAARWLVRELAPALRADLQRMGHIPGPFYFNANENAPERGFNEPTTGPRFSHGWGDARHLPSVLVETHSLKPYEQRVLGTYVLLESILRTAGTKRATLARAIREDRALRPAELVLEWRAPQQGTPSTIAHRGIVSRHVPSAITGGERIEWTGQPVTQRLPLVRQTEPSRRAKRPGAYWIPAAWSDIAERLALHGIAVERTTEPRTLDVEMQRIVSAKLDSVPFKGRVRVKPQVGVETRTRTYPAGSFYVSTDQPLGDLAMLLLEPESPDSFFQWGFFATCLQRTEYAEDYILEPMATRMLEENPALRQEFDAALRDARFAADPGARLRWFYERTPFFDRESQLYPVGKVPAAGPVPKTH